MKGFKFSDLDLINRDLSMPFLQLKKEELLILFSPIFRAVGFATFFNGESNTGVYESKFNEKNSLMKVGDGNILKGGLRKGGGFCTTSSFLKIQG